MTSIGRCRVVTRGSAFEAAKPAHPAQRLRVAYTHEIRNKSIYLIGLSSKCVDYVRYVYLFYY